MKNHLCLEGSKVVDPDLISAERISDLEVSLSELQKARVRNARVYFKEDIKELKRTQQYLHDFNISGSRRKN